MVPNKWKKCKNITFCHFLPFGGPCDVQKRVKVYKVYVSWKPWLHSLRWHPKKWFLSNWGRTRCNRSAQGLKMANCKSFKILTHIHMSTQTHTTMECALAIFQWVLKCLQVKDQSYHQCVGKMMNPSTKHGTQLELKSTSLFYFWERVFCN